MIRKLLRYLAPVFMTAGLLLGLGAAAAHASTGNGAQWRAVSYSNAPYMNAWFGSGGYVNDYDSQTLNNDFSYTYNTGAGHYQIEFTPGNCSGQSCEVVSDYGNSSGSARAGTYTNINGAPWGSLFDLGNCSVGGSPGHTFWNIHWQGYLDPGGDGSNGTPIYLNGGPAYCWVSYPAF